MVPTRDWAFVALELAVAALAFAVSAVLWAFFAALAALLAFALAAFATPRASCHADHALAEVPTRQYSLPVPSTLAVCLGYPPELSPHGT